MRRPFPGAVGTIFNRWKWIRRARNAPRLCSTKPWTAISACSTTAYPNVVSGSVLIAFSACEFGLISLVQNKYQLRACSLTNRQPVMIANCRLTIPRTGVKGGLGTRDARSECPSSAWHLCEQQAHWSISMRRKSPGDDNYVVGRGRPPLLTRWKPGQSGNPKGRPKGA